MHFWTSVMHVFLKKVLSQTSNLNEGSYFRLTNFITMSIISYFPESQRWVYSRQEAIQLQLDPSRLRQPRTGLQHVAIETHSKTVPFWQKEKTNFKYNTSSKTVRLHTYWLQLCECCMEMHLEHPCTVSSNMKNKPWISYLMWPFFSYLFTSFTITWENTTNYTTIVTPE